MVTNDPTISINICAYNEEDMLAKALDCMETQELDGEFSFEIVVIDDGSTDSTAKLVKDRAACSSVPLRYVFAEGKGVAHARNVGVLHSRGKWIAWFDQDQLTESTWLKELHTTALDNGADLVDGPRDLLLPNGQGNGLNKFSRACLGEIWEGKDVHKHMRRYASCTGNALVRKEAFDAVGGFDESIFDGWEDWDFIRRFRAAGYQCWYTPKALVHHAVSADRLNESFYEWHAARLGVSFASRDMREWGFARTALACMARLGQAFCVNLPLLAWAWLTGDRGEALMRKCLLLRAICYGRQTLFYLSPSLFGLEDLQSRSRLRNEPRYVVKRENPDG